MVKDDKPKTKKVKKKRGRSSRRRQAKIRSIQQAVEEMLAGKNNTCAIEEEEEEENGWWKDREMIVSEGVSERRLEYEWKETDSVGIVKQLGYCPGNAIHVACRVHHLQTSYPALYALLSSHNNNQGDEPCALLLYPLVKRHAHSSQAWKYKSRKRGSNQQLLQLPSKQPSQEETTNDNTTTDDRNENNPDKEKDVGVTIIYEPFPTTYWLTNPLIRTLISQVEIENGVSRMEAKLTQQHYLQQMSLAHQDYRRTRSKLWTTNDRSQFPNYLDDKNPRGIAGMTKVETVKCLHAHTAHYLGQLPTIQQNHANHPGNSNVNLVGQWTLQEIEQMLKTKQNASSKTTNTSSP